MVQKLLRTLKILLASASSDPLGLKLSTRFLCPKISSLKLTPWKNFSLGVQSFIAGSLDILSLRESSDKTLRKGWFETQGRELFSFSRFDRECASESLCELSLRRLLARRGFTKKTPEHGARGERARKRERERERERSLYAAEIFLQLFLRSHRSSSNEETTTSATT